jgi:methyltransferase (TIGR00027 family)
MKSNESLSGVGETALGAAMMRARESLRPDRLFDDPYAEEFVAAAPEAFADGPTHSGDGELAALEAAFSSAVVVRTRFYDDYLLAACAAGCRQVVLLAAGLDTRAFRLNWPARVRLFELDLPEVLAFKEGVLARRRAAPRCARTALPVDLREDWPAQLTDAGFEPSGRTVWLLEGLLTYLSNDDAVLLLTAVGELSSAGSQLSFDRDSIAEDSLLARARTLPTMNQVTSLWKGGLSENAPDWLRRHGWQVQTDDHATLAARYGRPAPDGSTGGFLTGVRLSRR